MAADVGNSRDSTPEGSLFTIIIVLLSLALYNVVELHMIIYSTFRTRRSLYFWSFLLSTWGIAIYCIGFVFRTLQGTYQTLARALYLYVTLIVLGWVLMVSGQSVVLYSRLHIVVHDSAWLRAVLAMIAVDALVCHVPTAIMVYGANSANPAPWILPYSICEKIQVTVFFVQETIISGLYIWHTLRLMSAESSSLGRNRDARRATQCHLVMVNVLIIALDVTILALEYAGLYAIQTAYKGLVYAVKLKLEFNILNRLVQLTQGSRSESSYARKHGRPRLGGALGGGGGALGGGGGGGSGGGLRSGRAGTLTSAARCAKDVPLRTLTGREPENEASGSSWEACSGGRGEDGEGRQTPGGVFKTVEVVIKSGRHGIGGEEGGGDGRGDEESLGGEGVGMEVKSEEAFERGHSSRSEAQFARAGH